MDTSPHMQTHYEWDAWQEVVKELRRLGVEINDQDDLNDYLKGWACEYARLAKIYPRLLVEPDRK